MPPKRPSVKGALNALVAPHLADAGADGVTTLPIGEIRPNPRQPRLSMREEALEALAASVRERGVLQPLVVRPVPGGHEVVAGERRLAAAKRAGLAEVPVVVRDVDDAEAEELALVENLLREDLDVFEEVDATARLVARELGIGPGEVQARLSRLLREPDPAAQEKLEALFARLGRGTWPSFAKHKLRVLKLPADVLEALRAGRLEYRKALVVGRVEDEGARAELLARAVAGATVEELRDMVAKEDTSVEDGARRVAKALSSARRLRALAPDKQAEVRKLVSRLEQLLALEDPR